MTNLKTLNEGFNKFCGPAVLSILTGKSTDECASVITKINGKYNITGVELLDLIKAAERLGFITKHVVPSGSLYRTLTSIIKNDGMYIVTVPNHFVCVEVNDKKIYFCDNHTKEPIPAASSARLGQPVVALVKVTKNPNFVEYKKPEPKPLPISLNEKLVIFIYDMPDSMINIGIHRVKNYSDSIENKKDTVAYFNLKDNEELKQLRDMIDRRLGNV